MTATTRERRRKLPAVMLRRRRAEPRPGTRPGGPLPREYARPGPAWRVGRYDGPADPAGRREEARFLATGIVPPVYRHNPGACHTLLLKAQALDIPESTALENIHWNTAVGKGALSAQLMAALLRRHRYEFKVTTETDERVTMTFYRLVDGRRRKLGEATWTMLEAVGAGLAWRDLWRNYPTDMLWARCLMRGARRYASEIGTGLAYTAEELHDMAAPEEGGEVAAAVLDILEKATSESCTAAHIKDDLVKEAKAKKLLDADTGDGETLGYVLGMLWGEKRAAEVDALQAAEPTPPPPVAGVTGPLECGCPAVQTLRTGKHLDGCRG